MKQCRKLCSETSTGFRVSHDDWWVKKWPWRRGSLGQAPSTWEVKPGCRMLSPFSSVWQSLESGQGRLRDSTVNCRSKQASMGTRRFGSCLAMGECQPVDQLHRWHSPYMNQCFCDDFRKQSWWQTFVTWMKCEDKALTFCMMLRRKFFWFLYFKGKK